MAHNRYDWFNALRVCFKVFGFYLKKLFIPVPLNFAIVQVSDYYVWLGVGGFLVTLFLVRSRSLAATMLAIAFYQILPALVIALTNVAWTPLAERYLYLPSAFFSIGVIGVAYQMLRGWQKEFVLAPACSLLLFPFALVSIQRNFVWQDNLSLYRDTLKKSPEFPILRNELAIALAGQREFGAANDQLLRGQEADSRHRSSLFLVNQARIALGQKNAAAARAILLRADVKSGSANLELQKTLALVDERRLLDSGDKASKQEIVRELIDTYALIYQKNHDPFTFYRRGQLAMFLGERQIAAGYFARAYAESSDEAYYKPAAKKLNLKLGKIDSASLSENP